MTVLRFMGFMYSPEPVNILCTMNLLALSEGWKASQNAKMSLLGHRLDAIVQSPNPLQGPCPQHAIFDVTNPTQPHNPIFINQFIFLSSSILNIKLDRFDINFLMGFSRALCNMIMDYRMVSKSCAITQYCIKGKFYLLVVR